MEQHNPNSEDEQTAEIEAQFPKWSVWVSDTGNWWASLRTALTLAQINAGCSPFVRADGPDALVDALREREALMAGAVAS